MILWINGSFGAGKTTVAHELQKRLEKAFVYDPENIGYFLRKNAPEECRTPDFQDVPLWRDFNYETLKWIAGTYPGVIIAPMTINRQQYFDEIIGRLKKDGVPVCHVILCAGRETLLERLRIRLKQTTSTAGGYQPTIWVGTGSYSCNQYFPGLGFCTPIGPNFGCFSSFLMPNSPLFSPTFWRFYPKPELTLAICPALIQN